MTRIRILTSAVALVGAGMIGGIAGPIIAGAQTPDQEIGSVYSSDGLTGRQLDTRASRFHGKPQAGDTVQVFVGIGSTDVVVSIKVTDTEANGYVSAYARGAARPESSVLDFQAGDTVSNLAIVPVSPDGVIVLYTSAPAHLVVDLQGRFGSTSVVFPTSVPPEPEV